MSDSKTLRVPATLLLGGFVAFVVVTLLHTGGPANDHHVIFDDPTEIDRWQAVVKRLWFEVAWPARPVGSATLTDLFEGLP